jgi:hypothetical protein
MTEPILSNYLSDDEWDALLYLFYGPLADEVEGNMGECFELGIARMMELGYVFEHLDEEGKPDEEKGEVESMNWAKLQIYTAGNPQHLDPLDHVQGGRDFLKEHAPDLLHDTDEEFAAHIEEAYTEMTHLVEEERKLMRRLRKGWVQVPIPDDVLNRQNLEGQRVYRSGRLVGTIQEIDDDIAWCQLDPFAWQEAGEGKIQFGLVLG